MAKEAVVHLKSNVVFGRKKPSVTPGVFFRARIHLNLLAIDTAGSDCRVGLVRNDGQLFLRVEHAEQSHSRCILSMIDALLHEATLQLSDLQLLVWNAGPGSFTGIRIAASVVQSLSLSLQMPFLSLSSLEVLAHASARQQQDASLAISVAMDARMNGVYWARFACTRGALTRVEDDRLMTKEEFAMCCESIDSAILAVGDAWPSTVPQANIAATIDDLLSLAQTKLQQEWLYRAEDCLPNYVQSNISWQKRARFQTP